VDASSRVLTPVWWNQRGAHMRLDRVDPTRLVIQNESKTAQLTINPTLDKWRVSLRLQHGPGWQMATTLLLSTEEVRAAFALSNTPTEGTAALQHICKFSGGECDTGEFGKFVRWDYFLNLPCAGTGEDGDPNLSLYLSPEIVAAVDQFLQRQARH
jgi:hypothetical protein